MAKYRRRVPAVEAFRWDGGKELWPTNAAPRWVTCLMRGTADELVIDRNSGYRLHVRVGDWIVIDGEDVRIVQDREFAETYEPAKEDDTDGEVS